MAPPSGAALVVFPGRSSMETLVNRLFSVRVQTGAQVLDPQGVETLHVYYPAGSRPRSISDGGATPATAPTQVLKPIQIDTRGVMEIARAPL